MKSSSPNRKSERFEGKIEENFSPGSNMYDTSKTPDKPSLNRQTS